MKNGSWAPWRSLLAARWVTDERVTRADGQHLFFGGDAYRCMYVVYRAVDRDEYWRLVAVSGFTRTREQDDDGLAPGEDPRAALTLLGQAMDGWAPCEGPMEIAFPRHGTPKVFVVASARGVEWPHAMRPGEWRPFAG